MKELLDAHGGPTAVAAATGTPRSHFSAMLNGSRGLGDGLAQKLELHFGKEPGWFDEPDRFWPFSQPLWAAVSELSGADRDRLEQVMNAHLGIPDKQGQAPQESPAQAKTGTPAGKPGPFLDTLRVRSTRASDQPQPVQKPRRRGNAA